MHTTEISERYKKIKAFPFSPWASLPAHYSVRPWIQTNNSKLILPAHPPTPENLLSKTHCMNVVTSIKREINIFIYRTDGILVHVQECQMLCSWCVTETIVHAAAGQRFEWKVSPPLDRAKNDLQII